MSETTYAPPMATELASQSQDPPNILIIDDEAGIRETLETLLELEGYQVDMAIDGEAGLARIEQKPFDLILLDLALPGKNGIEILSLIRERSQDLPVIMLTAYGTVDNVVDAIRAGAQNFVQKPWDNEKLLADIRSAIARYRAEEENVQLKRAFKQRYNFPNIIGKSEIMLRIFDMVAQVAPSRSTVLIQGVNTGAVPTDLLESTLFGHTKGAFTSAVSAKKGLFEVANGGTLFLDEIGTMPLDTQAKILRVLQDRRFMHLGGTHEIQVDVRIITATNVDLREAVREGKFREDLFYRLDVIRFELPPLRARREDIPALAALFLKRYSEENGLPIRTLSPEALRAMLDYEWPGNVRELENVMERGVVLSASQVIGLELLPQHITRRSYSSSLLEHSANASLFDIMEDIEKRIIMDKLERCNWNQTEAAEQFRIPLSTLNQKIKRLSIEIKKRIREN
jgi:DNA-binding NtrC family response regulator